MAAASAVPVRGTALRWAGHCCQQKTSGAALGVRPPWFTMSGMESSASCHSSFVLCAINLTFACRNDLTALTAHGQHFLHPHAALPVFHAHDLPVGPMQMDGK